MSHPPPSIIDDGIGAEPVSSPRGDGGKERQARFEAFLKGSLLSLDTLRRYARSGVPDPVRPAYWKVLLGYLPPRPAEWEQVEQSKEQAFNDLLRDACTLDAGGNVIPQEDERYRIDIDIPRTLPSLHFFACADDVVLKNGIPTTFSEAQQSLRRILYATAFLNRGLGYVQGMNELVAHLLITFAEGKNTGLSRRIEAQSFFCFQTLLSYIGDNFCRALDFDKEMGVSHTITGFSALFRFCDPELFAHIEGCNIKAEFYAFRWMTLLFTQEFLAPDVLRIWDFLFSYGDHFNEAFAFTAVAMLIFERADLLAMEGMSQVLVALQHYPSVDVGDLLRLAEKLIATYGLDKVATLRRSEQQQEDARTRPAAAGAAAHGQGEHNGEGKAVSRSAAIAKSVSGIVGRVFGGAPQGRK